MLQRSITAGYSSNMKPCLLVIFALVTTVVLPVYQTAAADDSPSAVNEEPIPREQSEFFETSIRPLLVERCYSCHSAAAEDLEGNLLLDSRAGIAAGGSSGEVISGRDPEASLLIEAVRWENPGLQMPPDGRLRDSEIAALERWVSMGAPDPRESPTATAQKTVRTIDLDSGRQWWAFQPVAEVPLPQLGAADNWPLTRIDHFILAKLNEHQLSPSPPADRGVLIRRAYLNLLGLRPTAEQ
ncbi:MAG: DUF1549 domain-containing protein, partial [Planctomycetales bacterium]|nr:DUF1549 domain-containing protein [Planctomycetales bacterium]